MNEQITKLKNNISEFWGKLSKKTRSLLISGIIVLIIISLAVTFILNNKHYVVLFNSISEQEAVEVLQKLQESNVDYKYENGGKILIPQKQENILRMQLAESGHPRTGSNYDIFTDGIDFMTTDYEKKVYEVFQLQERLQDSIETIEGVQEAIVTINLPKEKSFAWETDKAEASASVKINLKSGKSLTASQTNGILQLVSKSVQGLKEENVVIVDTNGNSLTFDDDTLQTNSIKLKLEIEKKFEQDAENSVRGFLATMYGAENVQVSANCKINFDKKISEMLQYIPDNETKKGVPSDSKNEREVTGPGQTVGGVTGTETNSEVPTYPGITIQGDDIYFKDTNAINYLVSQLKEQIEHNPGNIDSLTVAVVINKSKMSEEEDRKVRDLVAFSLGIEPTKVALHNMEFYNPDAPPVMATDPEKVLPSLSGQVLIYGGIGLAVIAIVIFILSIIIGKKRKKKSSKSNDTNKDSNEKPMDYSWKDVQEEIKLQETQEQVIKKQLKEFTRNNPEIAAQLIRTWVKGDDE